MTSNLRSLHGGPGAKHRPWTAEEEKELRDTFEDALRDADHVVVISLTKLPDHKLKQDYCRHVRGNGTFLEMVGAMYSIMHSWITEAG